MKENRKKIEQKDERKKMVLLHPQAILEYQSPFDP